MKPPPLPVLGPPIVSTQDPVEIAPERPCDCPPGWQHLPDCHVVTGLTDEGGDE